MENVNFMENLATRLGQNASVKNVFGEPIVNDGKTVIPVAQVAYGFGGGFGGRKRKNGSSANSQSASNENEKGVGEGAGGGGGMYAKAKGVYEITSTQTRFIPVDYNKQLLMAVLFGFLFRAWFFKRKVQKVSANK